MKIHDFGLWFHYWHNGEKVWSTTIPTNGWFYIYYDANYLGSQDPDDCALTIINDRQYIINLKKNFCTDLCIDGAGFWYTIYSIGRVLTMDDFEIVKNPDYQEQK